MPCDREVTWRPCAHGTQERSQDARANWEAALSAKDRAIAQLEEALASERKAAEQTRATAAGAVSQAAAKTSTAGATEAALADARQELERLRQQARMLVTCSLHVWRSELTTWAVRRETPCCYVQV